MKNLGLIIGREYLTRVRKKTFIIMTLLGPLLIAGVLALVMWLGLREDQHHRILVIDDSQGLFESLEDGKSFEFLYLPGLDLETAKESFKDSEYTAILWIPYDIVNHVKATLYFKEQPSNKVQRSIENRLEARVEEALLKRYNIRKRDYDQVRKDFNITLVKFSASGKEETVQQERAVIGFIFGIAVYLFIFIYGVQVMRGVIEEKTNRIVEVIISSVRPFELMLGKILGIALVSLTQFVLWIILSFTFITVSQSLLFQNKLDEAAMANVQQSTELLQQQQPALMQAQKVNPFDLTNPNSTINSIDWPMMIGGFLFYFLGGYLLYSALFAAIGAAVDNDTDTQQFMIPVTIPLLIAYFLSIALIENPDGSAGFWGSIIPFTSPVVMMVRMAFGMEGRMWELALSMVLLIVTFIAMTWLAAKIYRTGILMYGKKVNYKEIWKWIRYHD